MNIREIRLEDLDACASLFAQVFSSPPWNESWNQEQAKRRLLHFFQSKGFIGILAERDELVGFALGNTEPFYFGSMFYLREMCIASAFQKQGLGNQLYLALERKLSLEQVHSIYLTTQRETLASGFYLGNGFKCSDKMGFYAKCIAHDKAE
jgi:ribosomal protein S18 acetylase RimI-like enzyme